jgi:hypothetical protein
MHICTLIFKVMNQTLMLFKVINCGFVSDFVEHVVMSFAFCKLIDGSYECLRKGSMVILFSVMCSKLVLDLRQFS